MMASSPNDEVCMACGGVAIKGSRRVISSTKFKSTAITWKGIVSEEIYRRSKPVVDLGGILETLFLCARNVSVLTKSLWI